MLLISTSLLFVLCLGKELFNFFEFFKFIEIDGLPPITYIIWILVELFLIYGVNSFSCVVWVEDDIIKSKGLIYGFYKECPIKDIRSVQIQYVRHEGEYIYLIDNTERKSSRLYFKKTKKNLDFLRTFWNGELSFENNIIWGHT